MNKQEIIEKIKEMTVETLFSGTLFVKQKEVIKLIEQLDELEKVKIPQFVANWIEYCKFTHVDLQHALFVGDVYFYNYANQKDFSKLKEFLEAENNQLTFARAWLDGYEVDDENEKQYKVGISLSMPDVVNKPSHYQGEFGLEAIDVVKNFAGELTAVQGFYWGNAMKYLLRFQKKNGLEDLKKARKNLDWLIGEMEGKK